MHQDRLVPLRHPTSDFCVIRDLAPYGYKPLALHVHRGVVAALTLACVMSVSACSGSGITPPSVSPPPSVDAGPTDTPCLVESTPPKGTITRYAARPGSTWWAGYTVLTNSCEDEATITGASLSGVLQGSGAAWTGEATAMALADDAVPDAILPGSALTGSHLAGYRLKPGHRVEIMARVTADGARDLAHRVPALAVTLQDAGGPRALELSPDISLCACNPLK